MGKTLKWLNTTRKEKKTHDTGKNGFKKNVKRKSKNVKTMKQLAKKKREHHLMWENTRGFNLTGKLDHEPWCETTLYRWRQQKLTCVKMAFTTTSQSSAQASQKKSITPSPSVSPASTAHWPWVLLGAVAPVAARVCDCRRHKRNTEESYQKVFLQEFRESGTHATQCHTHIL